MFQVYTKCVLLTDAVDLDSLIEMFNIWVNSSVVSSIFAYEDMFGSVAFTEECHITVLRFWGEHMRLFYLLYL